MTDVLYITHNGITDHIGQSQIAPYNLGLAERGYRIHIVSAEKPGREALVERYRRQFEEAGISWSFVTYHNRPQVAAQFYDVMRMRSLALRIARAERPGMVHCRSWLPLEIGVAVKKATGARFLLDFRHFWIESGLQDSRYKFVYRMLAGRERTYFEASDHVVTLTRHAADILCQRYAGGPDCRGYTVIPCCADFDQFDLSRVKAAEVRQVRDRLAIPEGSTVLLYLGSIGAVYLLREMMALFRELLQLRPGAVFLFVCNNGCEQVFAAAKDVGLPLSHIRFTTAAREAVPAHLALADLSVMFFRPDLSLAGCSPTKMSELFAANVPVISNKGVGDLDSILSPERNASLTVPDFEPATLRWAVERLLQASAVRSHIRQRSDDFRLETGVARYAAIYEKLIGPPGARKSIAVPGSPG